MAKMRIALAALDLSARHSEAFVAGLIHVFLGDGLPEAGPTGARFKLGLGAEESVVAADAAIDSVVVIVPGATGVRPLRAAVPGHLVGGRRELLLPVRIGLDDAGTLALPVGLPRLEY